jgi:sugar (pentulose or hexulose) kinase
MTGMAFIGIDVGTSYIKGAALDPESMEIRNVVRVPSPEFLPGLPPSHREADPLEIASRVEEVLAAVSEGEPSCEGLVLCGQMHGVVLVDARGEPVSNYISWLDRRVTADDFAEIAGLVTPTEREAIGNEFRPAIALSVLYWLGRRGLLPRGATPVSAADFVAGRLCGRAPVMEPTQSAAFGALRLETLAWHEDVIGKLGLETLRWPEVRPSGSTVGLWRGAPCYASVGDQQCALAGALLAERELSVNIGTGSQIAILAGLGPAGGLQVRPYFDGRFLRTITHIPGGRALSALIRLFTEIGGGTEEEAWRRIEPAVESVPATDLRAGVAFYPGPCGQAGFLENLHEGNLSGGHVFRAVFESMAANYRECARRLDPERTANRAVFSGGVARRVAALRDQTAAALGLPFRLSPHPEDTLYGLLVLGLAFSGRRARVCSGG